VASLALVAAFSASSQPVKNKKLETSTAISKVEYFIISPILI
jgi:hypothetical protein